MLAIFEQEEAEAIDLLFSCIVLTTYEFML